MQKIDLESELRQNPYPGRGVVLGRAPDGKSAVVLYFIMGRSGNSRNRIFIRTEDGIRTVAFDPAKMTDPSLVIYHPVRFYDGRLIVTNGDQTDTVRDFMINDDSFESALRTRTFEPDAPNYTPRISGLVRPDGSYILSILKSMDGDPFCCCRSFFDYESPVPGVGHFIHTYRSDGDPLPSFDGEPKPCAIGADFDQFAGSVWAALNPDNKVSLYACQIDIRSGEHRQIIFNKNS